MDDGSKLLSNKTYKLYKDGKIVNIKENTLGRYSISGDEEEMRTVRGRIYINDISEGVYEIIDNDGKKVSFNITEEGKIYGNAKDNVVKERVIEASAIAELIISMQTGVMQGRYLLLITLISIIGILLLMIKRQKSMN